jgi:uncharacterized cupredoxin-like copper-binding protein
MAAIRRLIASALVVAPFLAHAHGETSHRARATQAQSVVETPFGKTGDTARVSRTIDVDMTDAMRFNPASITVRQGDTVRFRVKNSGKVMHEMVLGRDEDLKAHAEMMRKHPGMEHEEPYMAHVAPGKREDIIWQFTEPGEFAYGCLVPGHFEAGMRGRIRVSVK